MAEKRGNGFGVVGFVTSLIGVVLVIISLFMLKKGDASFFIGVFSFVVGGIAMGFSISQLVKNKTGLAVSALVISIVDMVTAIFIVAMYLVLTL